jgi:hypothetical protein
MKKNFLCGLILIFFFSCNIFSTKKNNQYINKQQILKEIYGTWKMDYEETTKSLLRKNSFDPEIDIDIYNNFLTQIKKEVPFAQFQFFFNENNQENLWQFDYTLTKDQVIKKTSKGTFSIRDINITDFYLILELKEVPTDTEKIKKEIIRLDLLEKNKIKLTLQNELQKNIFNEIYFIKTNHSENNEVKQR